MAVKIHQLVHSRQTAALAEVVTLTEELASRVDLLSTAATDRDLHSRVREVALGSLSACQRETARRAESLHARLLRLRDHPKLDDPRLASHELQDALLDAASLIAPLAESSGDLAVLGDWVEPVELTERATLVLGRVERAFEKMSAGLAALKEAAKAPIPGADAVFVRRGSRQRDQALVVWLEMRRGSDGRSAATLFALDESGDVLESSTWRSPWEQWDILEFQFPGIEEKEIGRLRLQLS